MTDLLFRVPERIATTTSTAPRRRANWTGFFVVPLGIYLVSRLLTTAMLSWSARSQDALPSDAPIMVTRPLPASPSVLEASTNWDGQWYWNLVGNGYPVALPGASDVVQQTSLAFYPGYPTLVEGVMAATRAPFPLAAVAVSTIAGAVAVVLLHRIFLRAVSPFAAAAGVTLLCAWPGAAVLQVAYTESLALLLIVFALHALIGRRYLAVAGVAVALGLVRPLALPLAAVVVVHAITRMRDRSDGLPGPDRVRVLVALAGCGIGVVAWPALAALRTGDLLAYPRAMEAWAPPGDRWGGWFSLLVGNGEFLLLGVVLLAIGGFLKSLRNRRGGRTWPLELRAWAGVYVLFVLATTMPTIGIARYLVLALVPFCPFPVESETESVVDRRARWVAFGVLTALFLAGQYWWVSHVFVIDESPLLQSYP